MIKLRGVGYRYANGQTALDNVDLTVEGGQMLGIVGPNGAGKSTLLRLMAGLPGAQGEILLGGQPLAALGPRQLARRVALVPQSSTFSFPFRVEEVVMMGRYLYLDPLGFGEEKQRAVVERCLERTSLTRLRKRRVNELSGGETQRVRIAQALAQDPEILLLDEPTAHLDVHLQLELMELFGELNREQGLTVVLSLHDLNLASAYCHRLVLLDEGKIVLEGESASFCQDPKLEEVFRVRFGFWTGQDEATRVFPLKKLKVFPTH